MARKQTKPTKQAEIGQPKEIITALYLRVSTKEQAEKFGLDAQRSELEAYCKAHGWVVSEENIYIDAGISGKSADRPAFQAMLQAAQDRRIGRIVTVKLDRIARNLRDLLNTVDALEKYGCALIVKKEQFDTSTPQGRFVLQMLGAVSELERSMIAERVEGGRLEKAKAGGNLGKPAPYGYAYSGEKLVIVPDQADVVRQIYSDFLAGGSMNSIAHKLNTSGTPTQGRRAGSSWYPVTVQNILKNGLYAGLAQWDGIETDSADCEAIIDLDTYEAAQRRLQALRPGRQSSAEIERRLAQPDQFV